MVPDWTKKGGRCHNWKTQMRHFKWFSNTVIFCHRRSAKKIWVLIGRHFLGAIKMFYFSFFLCKKSSKVGYWRCHGRRTVDKCIREKTRENPTTIMKAKEKNRNFRLYFPGGGTEAEERSEISFKVAIPNVMANLEETRFGILKRTTRETQLLSSYNLTRCCGKP